MHVAMVAILIVTDPTPAKNFTFSSLSFCSSVAAKFRKDSQLAFKSVCFNMAKTQKQNRSPANPRGFAV